MADFASQVKAWTTKAKARMVFVAKNASTMIADTANTPKSHGGHMPVLTSFLMESLNVGYGSMPSGPSIGPWFNPKTGEIRVRDPFGDKSQVPVKIQAWDLTTTLFVGWTAEYAGTQDDDNGFVEYGVGNWDKYVRVSIGEAKGKIP